MLSHQKSPSGARPGVIAALTMVALLAVAALCALRNAHGNEASSFSKDALPPSAPKLSPPSPNPVAKASPPVNSGPAPNSRLKDQDSFAPDPPSSLSPSPTQDLRLKTGQPSAAQRISAIQSVLDGDDAGPAKLNTVMSALEDPDSRVRAAALQAVIELDDRGAIPRLKELAAKTVDEGDKAALIEAADHLALPSLSEYEDSRRTQTQRSTTNRR